MDKQPTMMTIREVARTGILSEHALRVMVKEGKLPVLYGEAKKLPAPPVLSKDIRNG